MKKELTTESIKKIIYETAKFNKKKEELWNETVNIVNKLNALEESHKDMVGSYGFKTGSDVTNTSKTGFENDFFANKVSELGAEVQAAKEKAEKENEEKEQENQDLVSEIKKLKEELEGIKKEQKSLKEGAKKKSK